METVTIMPADEVPQRDYVQALNAAYADYYVPIYVTPHFFREMLRRESIDIGASVAAVVGNEVVGTSLLGVRGPRGWIGGVGVVPGWRRQGIARLMMERVLETAHSLDLSRIQLEVIDENAPAIHLYESLDFQATRTLFVMYCSKPQAEHPGHHPFDLNRIGPPLVRALRALEQIPHPPDPWQREIASIKAMRGQTRAVLASEQRELAGVCLYSGDTLGIGILGLACHSPFTGQVLLAELFRRYPNAAYTYLNVPANDPQLPALEAMGFTVGVTQYEMVYYA
ncbi:MAG: GNAT family N-acetyltransferase [Chloroflexi bacterium]|nr:GNAT family N-acetyltransferase [Chloroflexota bacterium]